MAKEIRISFDLLGNSKIDANGYVGKSCEQDTQAFVQAMNATKTDDTKKPEYSMPSPVNETVGQRW